MSREMVSEGAHLHVFEELVFRLQILIHSRDRGRTYDCQHLAAHCWWLPLLLLEMLLTEWCWWHRTSEAQKEHMSRPKALRFWELLSLSTCQASEIYFFTAAGRPAVCRKDDGVQPLWTKRD